MEFNGSSRMCNMKIDCFFVCLFSFIFRVSSGIYTNGAHIIWNKMYYVNEIVCHLVLLILKGRWIIYYYGRMYFYLRNKQAQNLASSELFCRLYT